MTKEKPIEKVTPESLAHYIGMSGLTHTILDTAQYPMFQAVAGPGNGDWPDPNIKSPEEVNTTDYLKQWVQQPVNFWGEDNKFPIQLDEEMQKCNILEAGLKRLGDTMYGQGLFLYEYYVENNKRLIREIDDPDVYAFLDRITYNDYFRKACKELPTYGNIVPMHRLTEDGKYGQIYMYDTYWCRQEKRNIKTKRIENIYVTAQWWRGVQWLLPDGVIPDSLKNWIYKFPMLNDFDPAVQLQAASQLKDGPREYAQWLKYPTSGWDYGRAPWHAAYRNRWTGIAASIPSMKVRLTEYALTINYMIGIHEDFWKSKYKDWNNPKKWNEDAKAAEITRYHGEIEKNLAGKDNAFKSIFYSIYQRGDGTIIPSIKIDPVNNQMRTSMDSYIPDVQMANGEVLGAIGLDPSMLGYVVPGGKQSGGSGSNIREAMLALNAWLKPDRDLINKPFYVARDTNWPDGSKKNVMIGVRDYVIDTLDLVPPVTGHTTTPKQ